MFVYFVFFSIFCPLIFSFRSDLFYSFEKYFQKNFQICSYYFTIFYFIDKMTGTISNVVLMVRDEDGLRNYGEICLRINYDTFVEVVTNRVFVIVDKFILSDLKKLAHSFSLKWHF